MNIEHHDRQVAQVKSRSLALGLFIQHGYDAVSMAAIAKQVGVFHMTFFRHFPAKETVVVTDMFDPALAAGVSRQPET